MLQRYLPGDSREQLALETFTATSATTAYVTATEFRATYHPAKATTTTTSMHLILLRTTNGGTTWTQIPLPRPASR